MLSRFVNKTPSMMKMMTTRRMFSAYQHPVLARVTQPAPNFEGMAWVDN